MFYERSQGGLLEEGSIGKKKGFVKVALAGYCTGKGAKNGFHTQVLAVPKVYAASNSNGPFSSEKIK